MAPFCCIKYSIISVLGTDRIIDWINLAKITSWNLLMASARPDLSRSNYLWWLLISTIVVVNFFYCILELCQLKFKKSRHLSNFPDGFGTNKIKQLLFNCVPYGLMPYIQLNWTVVQYIQSMKPLTGNNIAINKMLIFSDAHSNVCRSGEIPVSIVLQRLALSLRGC